MFRERQYKFRDAIIQIKNIGIKTKSIPFEDRIKGRHALKKGRFWILFGKREGITDDIYFLRNAKDSGLTSFGKNRGKGKTDAPENDVILRTLFLLFYVGL